MMYIIQSASQPASQSVSLLIRYRLSISQSSHPGFLSSSTTAEAGRDEGAGDEARLFAPRDTLIVILFLPLVFVPFPFSLDFCLSVFAFSALFVKSLFAAGVGDTDSGRASFSSSSSSSNISVLRSCP